MNESRDPLMAELQDTEYRYAYAEDFLNTFIATQITVLREQRDMRQETLAALIGTKQPGISRLENVNYSGWKVETLKKLARAFGVYLKISFEPFGVLLNDDKEFSRTNLQRIDFKDDPLFQPSTIYAKVQEELKAMDLAKLGQAEEAVAKTSQQNLQTGKPFETGTPPERRLGNVVPFPLPQEETQQERAASAAAGGSRF